MRKRRKPSTTLGYPNLTSEQIGQFIVRMQAVREYEEKLRRLLEEDDDDLSTASTELASKWVASVDRLVRPRFQRT